MNYYVYDFGKFGLFTIREENNTIIDICFGKKDFTNSKYFESDIIKKMYKQMSEYFEGKRREFDIDIRLSGTEFQNKVLNELRKIPYGETVSYLDIAKRVGNSKASRAVGMANHNNRIPIVIPCHRVIGTSGKLTGYAGGLDIKEKLLDLEGIKYRKK